MKPCLPVLFICLFACQALYASASREHLYARFAEKGPSNIPHRQALQVLFNLPTILTGFLEYQDTDRELVQLYQYFLDERLFKNLVHDFFRFIDQDGNGVITQQEYQTAINEASIDSDKANRVYSLAAIDNPSRELGFNDFVTALELLFDESISTVTFAHLLGNPSVSQNVGVSRNTLVTGIQAIFADLPDNYPKPGCDQLEYLFREFDRDGDNKLNSKEFFHVLSIFLKYYKSGLDNNKYAKLVHRDDLFTLLWDRQGAETSEVVRKQYIDVNLEDLFQLAVFEKILSAVAQSLFQIIDENGNGVIDVQEFKKAINLFNAPEKEALLLYTTADTDNSGSLDFGEFLVVFETFVRKALASFGYQAIKLTGDDVNLENVSNLWQELAEKFDVDIGLTDEAFETLYNTIDVDQNTLLDIDEFAQFTTTLITSIKKTLRTEIDVKVSVVTATNATQDNIATAYDESVESGAVNNNVTVAQGIVARILSKASIAASIFSAVSEVSDASITVTTTDTEFETEGSAKMDNAMMPGAGGFAFSLYQAVARASQTNIKDGEFNDYGLNVKSPSGMEVLLQGKLRSLQKYDF